MSLSRDTTETDLKQRREIVDSTVHYVDQVLHSLKQRREIVDSTVHYVDQVLHSLKQRRETVARLTMHLSSVGSRCPDWPLECCSALECCPDGHVYPH